VVLKNGSIESEVVLFSVESEERVATWLAEVGIRFCGCNADKQKFRSVLELKLMWGCRNAKM